MAADLDPVAVKELAADRENIVTVGDQGWDATDPDACDRLLAETVAALGTVDRVVSTVGWTAITPFLDESPDYWRRIVDVNLMSSIYLAAAAGRVMRETGGSIVLTSSEAGVVGTSGETVYSATKAGVIALAKSLAREWARFGDTRECRRARCHADTAAGEPRRRRPAVQHRPRHSAATRRGA